ncbi:macrophage-expressed gene 1 protein-like [Dreissena polymorpha]|uniref:macrophage-expressed gene 1 protein-like n=1 Tax=Dreissena polymorpha TaxID=45954 RepID=UPI002263F276|nr:macrophage-expressed gene 1 protein-like [Dreissena polymorpha]
MCLLIFLAIGLLQATAAEFDTYDHRVHKCRQEAVGEEMRFEVLPGRGWDNLINKEMSMVFEMTYSECRKSEDGKYLLPDQVTLVPKKASSVQTHAEVMDHWDNYTSTTAHSMNIGASLSFDIPLDVPGLSVSGDISGKYSEEYQDVKTRQYQDQSITTRVQLRYIQYTAKLEEDMPFTKAFQKRIKKIAAHVALKDLGAARYDSQLLVRDFGTHVITAIDAGAALVKVDHVSKQYVSNLDDSQKSKSYQIAAKAGLSFLHLFNVGPQLHFGMDSSSSESSQSNTGYDSQITSSKISTHGGPVYKSTMSVDEWSSSLDNNLVAMDRSGAPISNFINEFTLPEVDYNSIQKVKQFVMNAVVEYYKHNVYRGCTSLDSENFSFWANVDDGSCKPPKAAYSLGGVYQTCNGDGELCNGKMIKNPKTGDYSCPSNYNSYRLSSKALSGSHTDHECHRCWIFFHCCNDVSSGTSASVDTFWCAPMTSAGQNEGYMFGGYYTSSAVNIFNQEMSCPPKYQAITILEDVTVCLSDDFEVGSGFSLPFAGFFSCDVPNPMANGSKGCPMGFSQHLLEISSSQCEFYYCIRTGALSAKGLTPIKSLPFARKPMRKHQTRKEMAYIISDDGQTWAPMDKANETIPRLLREQGIELVMSNLSPSANASEIATMSMVLSAARTPNACGNNLMANDINTTIAVSNIVTNENNSQNVENDVNATNQLTKIVVNKINATNVASNSAEYRFNANKGQNSLQ